MQKSDYSRWSESWRGSYCERDYYGRVYDKLNCSSDRGYGIQGEYCSCEPYSYDLQGSTTQSSYKQGNN